VTVVEWGGGLAEGLAADRLEITIDRPRARPARSPGEDPGEGDEPRTVRVTGAGPRWESAADSAGMAVRDGREAL